MFILNCVKNVLSHPNTNIFLKKTTLLFIWNVVENSKSKPLGECFAQWECTIEWKYTTSGMTLNTFYKNIRSLMSSVVAI
jgi:hypothetical protein